METTEINVRGSINRLEVKEKVLLPKSVCVVSIVRTTAGAITTDTGKKFTVSAVEDKDNIIVTRIS